jgi:small subunit ribosomal protein S9
MVEKKTTKKETTAKKPVAKKSEKTASTTSGSSVIKKKATPKVKVEKKVEVVEEIKTEPLSISEMILPEFVGDKGIDEDFVFDESKYDENSSRYFEATGRRKTAVARVRLYTKGDKNIIINGKDIADYFKTIALQKIVASSLDRMKSSGRFRITVIVNGGGINSQAEAVRHGITRALVIFNPEYKKRLRKAGYLTRDSRMKERKKFGLKRARRAPQWSKR